jgi:hypothetical protein
VNREENNEEERGDALSTQPSLENADMSAIECTELRRCNDDVIVNGRREEGKKGRNVPLETVSSHRSLHLSIFFAGSGRLN